MYAPISNGWPSRKLKHVARIQSSNVDKKSDPDETRVRLCNYTDVYYHERLTDSLPLMEATATPEELRRFELRPGDVLLTKDSETWDDIGVPAYVAEPIDRCVCGYHLAHLRPRAGVIDGAFLARALSACGVREQFHVSANGITRYGLTLDDMGEVRVPTPPLPTQRAIVAFLDRETAKIDTLIEKKRRLLDLLDEKCTALITRAVTRGLDPDVPTKDSGVEWLGEIPAHWDVAPVYAGFDVALGKMLDSKTISGQHLAPYLRNQDVQWRSINTDDLPSMDFSPADRRRYRLEPGDLLVCEGGKVGRAAVWDGQIEECYYQKALHRVRARGDDSVRYLFYVIWVAAHLGVFEAGSNPNTINHLTAVKLRHHRITRPPPSEQHKLADCLDEVWEQAERLKHQISSAIALLQEFRTALISAAVTGILGVPPDPTDRAIQA